MAAAHEFRNRAAKNGGLDAAPRPELEVLNALADPPPTLSVVMCTCNGAAFVEEQVRSILDQSWLPDELVVRDDASDDDTVARVTSAWAPPDHVRHRLRVSANTWRLGVAGNFEAALRDCSGELIALCDQDDRWPRDRLATLAKCLLSHPGALLVHGNARLIDAQGADRSTTLFEALGVTGEELRRVVGGQAIDVLLDRNLVTGATVLIRRELLDLALPIPQHWIHDEWLGVIAAAVNGLVLEQEVVLEYRQHGANQIGAGRPPLRQEVRRLLTPRGSSQIQRYERAKELHARLEALGSRVPGPVVAAAAAKVQHHATRAALPSARWRRLLPVAREVATGRYRRFGRGWRGALNDLVARA